MISKKFYYTSKTYLWFWPWIALFKSIWLGEESNRRKFILSALPEPNRWSRRWLYVPNLADRALYTLSDDVRITTNIHEYSQHKPHSMERLRRGMHRPTDMNEYLNQRDKVIPHVKIVNHARVLDSDITVMYRQRSSVMEIMKSHRDRYDDNKYVFFAIR